MYVITRLLNGKFYCAFRLQDGTEYYTYATLEEAIRGAKSFAKVVNHNPKLKKKNITFLQETRKRVTQSNYVEWRP